MFGVCPSLGGPEVEDGGGDAVPDVLETSGHKVQTLSVTCSHGLPLLESSGGCGCRKQALFSVLGSLLNAVG